MLGTSYVGMFVELMTVINGMLLETKLMKAVLIFFVFKKPKGKPLICSIFKNLHLRGLTNLISVLLWVLQGASEFAGLLPIFLLLF